MRRYAIHVARNRTGKTRFSRYGNGSWLLWLGPVFVSRIKRAADPAVSGTERNRA